jgi:antitoxin ParD1/3/4
MSAAEKISITLPPELNRMIKDRVETGQFGSTSEFIREALRVWKRDDDLRQQQLAAIRARIQASLDDPRPSIPMEKAYAQLQAFIDDRKKRS